MSEEIIETNYSTTLKKMEALYERGGIELVQVGDNVALWANDGASVVMIYVDPDTFPESVGFEINDSLVLKVAKQIKEMSKGVLPTKKPVTSGALLRWARTPVPQCHMCGGKAMCLPPPFGTKGRSDKHDSYISTDPAANRVYVIDPRLIVKSFLPVSDPEVSVPGRVLAFPVMGCPYVFMFPWGRIYIAGIDEEAYRNTSTFLVPPLIL